MLGSFSRSASDAHCKRSSPEGRGSVSLAHGFILNVAWMDLSKGCQGALSSWASHLPTLRLFAHVLIGVKDPPPGRTHERGGLPAMLALRATLIRTKQEVPKL